MGLISCSTYKIAERHLNKKMHRANLVLKVMETDFGDSIEYWDSENEEKPVLLLVHGFGATTKYQWYKQVKMLSENYRVIAPNLNYFGKTIPGETNYSVQGQVEMLERFTQKLKIDSMTVFGVSYGGLVGIEFAQRNQAFIQQMILFDTPVKFSDSADIENVKQIFDAASIEDLFVPNTPKDLNKLMELATGKKSRIPGGFLKEFHQKSYEYNREDKRALITSLLSDMEFYSNRDYSFELPILLIWGEEDQVVAVERGKQLAEYLGPKTEFKVIEKAAHMPNMTHEKEFNRIVSEFLKYQTKE